MIMSIISLILSITIALTIYIVALLCPCLNAYNHDWIKEKYGCMNKKFCIFGNPSFIQYCKKCNGTMSIQSNSRWPTSCWSASLTNLIHYSSIIIHSDGSALSQQQMRLLALESLFCDGLLGPVFWYVLGSLPIDLINLFITFGKIGRT